MPRHPTNAPTASRWLAAERRGEEAEAEQSLAILLEGFLAVPAAPPWLVGAVMEGLPRARRWTLERLAALLFVASGVGVAFSRWWFPLLVDGVALGARAVASFSLAAWIAGAVEGLASLWILWREIGHVGWLVGLSPWGLAILAACSLLSFGAARLLHRLLHERSSAHAR